MNKLAVIIPFYKRFEITELCFKRLKYQSNKYKFDVITAGSEGEKSRSLAERYGHSYIEVPNNPLTGKMNALIQECKDYDGVVIFGSDNFMSPSVIKTLQEIDCTEAKFYSFDNIHVYSVHHNKLATDIQKIRGNNPTGLCRMFTKEALKEVKYKVWKGARQSGLDMGAKLTMDANKIPHGLLSYEGHFILDVKHELNLTRSAIVNAYEETDINELKQLGVIHKEILALKPGKESIRPDKIKVDKIPAKIIKSFHDYKEGDTQEFKEHIFRSLQIRGYIERV